MVHTSLRKLDGKPRVSMHLQDYRPALSERRQDSGGVGGAGEPTVCDNYPRRAKERVELAR